MTRCTFGDTNVFFYSPKFDRNRGSHWTCICHTVFRLISCLQINWQPFYLCQLLKFHLVDWLIEICLHTEGKGTHHKMLSLQTMPCFPPLFIHMYIGGVFSTWEGFHEYIRELNHKYVDGLLLRFISGDGHHEHIGGVWYIEGIS